MYSSKNVQNKRHKSLNIIPLALVPPLDLQANCFMGVPVNPKVSSSATRIPSTPKILLPLPIPLLMSSLYFLPLRLCNKLGLLACVQLPSGEYATFFDYMNFWTSRLCMLNSPALILTGDKGKELLLDSTRRNPGFGCLLCLLPTYLSFTLVPGSLTFCCPAAQIMLSDTLTQSCHTHTHTHTHWNVRIKVLSGCVSLNLPSIGEPPPFYPRQPFKKMPVSFSVGSFCCLGPIVRLVVDSDNVATGYKFASIFFHFSKQRIPRFLACRFIISIVSNCLNKPQEVGYKYGQHFKGANFIEGGFSFHLKNFINYFTYFIYLKIILKVFYEFRAMDIGFLNNLTFIIVTKKSF